MSLYHELTDFQTSVSILQEMLKDIMKDDDSKAMEQELFSIDDALVLAVRRTARIRDKVMPLRSVQSHREVSDE